MREIRTDDAPAAIGPYVQAREQNGVVECAGQIGLTPDGDLVDGVEHQTRQALQNLEAVLGAAGCGWDDVLKVRIYLTNMDTYQQVNEVYASTVSDHAPARAVVGVDALPAGASVEIEATAMVPR